MKVPRIQHTGMAGDARPAIELRGSASVGAFHCAVAAARRASASSARTLAVARRWRRVEVRRTPDRARAHGMHNADEVGPCG